jgi:hypothetical protein
VNHCVFIHTNHKQIVGALVAEHALRRNSRHNDQFEVRIIEHKDYPFFRAREGQLYLRDGVKRPWLNEDLQSFTPLRFMPPELMGYQGRAVVIDPDIFAVGDAWELLTRDMQGKAILCRRRAGPKGRIDGCLASSVMLLDCAKLTHWKAGLPIDWRPAERFRLFPPVAWLMRARRKLFGEYGLLGRYQTHPDPAQETFFFGLLKELVEQGRVSEALLREQMQKNHVRHDTLEVLARTPKLAGAWR